MVGVMMRKLRNLVLILSGARPEIFGVCPEEQARFEGLGWAILVAGAIAAVSVWFALTSALRVNPLVAVVPALAGGLIIMGAERWLVTSVPLGDSHRAVRAIFRVGLALLLGGLIVTPIVLGVFQPQINAQIKATQLQRAEALAEQQSRKESQAAQQVAYWAADVYNLRAVINSRGKVALNPATEPQLASLKKQRAAQLALEQSYYKQWLCELQGGSGCQSVVGSGALAGQSERSYLQASARVAALTQEIQQLENLLSATDAASEQARYQQAISSLPGAQQQLEAAEAAFGNATQHEQDAEHIEAAPGLLSRAQALNELLGTGGTLTAVLLVFLVVLMIECVPVSVELILPSGRGDLINEYERAA